MTPQQITHSWPAVDWYKFLCLWEKLPHRHRRAADSVGVNEGFLARAVSGNLLLQIIDYNHSIHYHSFRLFSISFCSLSFMITNFNTPGTVGTWTFKNHFSTLEVKIHTVASKFSMSTHEIKNDITIDFLFQFNSGILSVP